MTPEMTPAQIATARACHAGAADGTLSFPEILATLAAAGFEGYLVDYRSGTCRYYLTSGASTDCAAHPLPVALPFDAPTLAAAIRHAQSGAADYSYAGFSARVTQAGCAGYIVSLAGRRVVYFGRTAETHVEHFPA